jgi:hypothetical protein
MRIELKGVRISWPKLFKAEAYGDGEAVFSATFLFAPGSPAHKLVEKAMADAAKEKWGEKGAAQLRALYSGGKVCLRDGDSKAGTEGYEGMLFVNARSKKRPPVYDADNSLLTEDDAHVIDGGDYVSAMVDVYAQDNGFGKRINASLAGVKLVRSGERFSGSRAVAATDFSTVDELEDLLA